MAISGLLFLNNLFLISINFFKLNVSKSMTIYIKKFPFAQSIIIQFFFRRANFLDRFPLFSCSIRQINDSIVVVHSVNCLERGHFFGIVTNLSYSTFTRRLRYDAQQRTLQTNCTSFCCIPSTIGTYALFNAKDSVV